MWSKFAILALLAFSGLTLFGFLAMGDMGVGHNTCLASFANGGECPNANNLFAYAAFHLDALQSFTNAVFESAVSVGALFALLAFTLLLYFLVRQRAGVPRIALTPSFLRARIVSAPVVPHDIIRWLSLHENSPSVA